MNLSGDSMPKTARRLFVATLFSATGFAATFMWYKLTESKDTGYSTAKPIARLVSTVNDVQKKSVAKIIWQTAIDNEVLRVGEAIRTAANSEARIEFLGSNTAIDLEPDSAIVLQENDGKLSLDFLKGNILVKSDSGGTASGGQDITLKSGGKEIALGKSEITLGKNKTGDLDVQVLTGKVSGLDGLSTNKIKILRPLPGSPIYVNPKENDFAKIHWQTLPLGYQVFVEEGSSRDNLKPVPGAVELGEKGLVSANLTVGKGFFRLIARSQNPALPELSSAIIRMHVIAKIAPTPLAPEKDAVVKLNKLNPDLELLWSNPAGFEKLILEIATTPDLKQKVKVEHLSQATQYKFTPEKGATYYWRVSGVLDGKTEVISSAVQKFNLTLLNELLPPLLESPAQNEKIQFDSIKTKGLVLSWKASIGAQRYKVKLEKNIAANGRTPASSETIYAEEGEQLQAKLKDLKPGAYSWTVAAIGAKDENSKPSEKRSFSVQTLPTLNWADGKLREDYYYLTLKPSLALKWEKGDLLATSWRIRIYKGDSELNPIVQKVNTTGAEMSVPEDGAYTAEIEAYNDREVLIAKSQSREIKVAPAPLLPAPQFSSVVPSEIEASRSGTASVQWQQVPGANKYMVSIKTPNGEVSKEISFNKEEAALSGLMPGDYNISLRSVDEHGRMGPEGEARKLKVPAESNLRAPKLKGVKIK